MGAVRQTVGRQRKKFAAELPLYRRMVNCPACGSLMDRDYKAAHSIRSEGTGLLEAA